MSRMGLFHGTEYRAEVGPGSHTIRGRVQYVDLCKNHRVQSQHSPRNFLQCSHHVRVVDVVQYEYTPDSYSIVHCTRTDRPKVHPDTSRFLFYAADIDLPTLRERLVHGELATVLATLGASVSLRGTAWWSRPWTHFSADPPSNASSLTLTMPCPPLVEVGEERVMVTLGMETSTLGTVAEEHGEQHSDGTDGDQADLERPWSTDDSSFGVGSGSDGSDVSEGDLDGAAAHSDSVNPAAPQPEPT
jgi:hypothetical protein